MKIGYQKDIYLATSTPMNKEGAPCTVQSAPEITKRPTETDMMNLVARREASGNSQQSSLVEPEAGFEPANP